MGAFEELLYTKAREGILGISEDVAADVYALSFFHWVLSDDPRTAYLAVGYNTNARCRFCTPAPGQEPRWPIASDSQEAKWNYAFWLQEEGTACEVGNSPEHETVRQEWIEAHGLWYTDQEQDADFDTTLALGSQIMPLFIRACVLVARRLHDDGTIVTKFGRPIPILVHELEYYDQIAEATTQANPPGLAAEFIGWIHSL